MDTKIIRMREKVARDRLFLRLFINKYVSISDEEVEYFRKHPDEIDEVTAPVTVHKLFLVFGNFLGILLVGASKILEHQFSFTSGFEDFFASIVFELGVALIGASCTAYLLGILLNMQQQNAGECRDEIRRRIAEIGDQGPT